MSRVQPTLHPCRFDARFSFALLLPAGARARHLMVTIHDSTREIEPCLGRFASFADEHDTAVLAPLFPPGVLGDGNENGYKLLCEGDIRYDRVLNAMVDQVLAETGCPAQRLLLHGYSGGGQFVHRYWFLHPGRLRAVVVGAPGEVTLLDDQCTWWAGVQDTVQRFGVAVDAAALRQVPAYLLVGERDTHTDELSEQPPSRFWPSDAARLVSNRIDRLTTLHRSLQQAGVAARLETMPDASHGSGQQLSVLLAQRFFAQQLA